MKKLISAALAFALSVSTLVPVFAADTFKDVNSKSYSWAYNYVEDMAERGLIKGYEDGTFRPGNSVSRMDAFALFARLMGSNSEVNADILAAAKEKYKAVLAKYDLSYAEGDIAYMMSRGVLLETELDTYFEGKKKSEAMPRYEAAILITKAMLGEQDAKKEVLVDMDYTDVSSIPKNAKQYVYYVTQKEIMSGMGDGAFSPATDVLRGQIAVMLSRTADAMNYTFDGVTLGELDETSKNIGIQDSEGRDFTIGYGDGARFFRDAEPVVATQMRNGQRAVLTYVSDGTGSKLAFADVFTGEIDSKLKVIYKGSNSGNISVTDPSDNTTKTYALSSTVTVKADGKEIKVNELKEGDYIEIGLAGDEVLSIEAIQKNAKVEAVIEKVGALGTITISSADSEFDGATLSMAEVAIITKNNDVAAFSDLGRGDKATIVIEYGRISRINAMSDSKTVTGTLKACYVSVD
ncbi:MAG: S-layer homology domain-containing protein, partial [Clostridia bacterium]|nr:S-layer homology domain-containing protein [Clostridia bacterium]